MRMVVAILAVVGLCCLSGCAPRHYHKCDAECACRTTEAGQNRCLIHCGIAGHGDCVCRPDRKELK